MLALQSRIDKSWHLGAVLVIAAALRLSVFAFTALPAVLETRPELSTPITSFRSRESRLQSMGIYSLKTVREGVFIHASGTNPYHGGVFHHVYLLQFRDSTENCS